MVDTDDVAVAASLQDTKRSDADFADDDMCGDGDDNGSCSGASGSRAGPCIDTGATSDAEGRNETESHKPFLFGRVSQFAGQVDLGNQDSGTSAYLEWSNSADDTAYCHAEQGLQSSSPEAVSYEGDSRITRLYPEQSQYVPADITIQQRDEFTSASVMLRTLFNSALTRTASASAENCKHPQPNFHHHIVTPGEQHGFNSDFHFRNNSALVTPAQERRQLLDSQGSSPQGVLQNGNSYSASVAKKATEENLALRMSLEEAQASVEALEAANEALRESNSQLSHRVKQTVEALKIASGAAAHARADSDASNSKVRGLASQVAELVNAMDETKKTYEAIHEEHSEISESARQAEERLKISETMLVAAKLHGKQLRVDHQEARARSTALERELRLKSTDAEQLNNRLKRAQSLAKERDVLERSRSERYRKIESELAAAEQLIAQVSEEAADQKTLTSDLNVVIKDLRVENGSLQVELGEEKMTAQKERERLHKELSTVEISNQELRIKAAACEQELNTLNLDKCAAEKVVSQLKARLVNCERRLWEATDSIKTQAEKQEISSSKCTPFSVPPLPGALSGSYASNLFVKESDGMSSHSLHKSQNGGTTGNSTNRCQTSSILVTECAICKEKPSGLMRSCQCEKSCGKKAHAVCLAERRKALGCLTNVTTFCNVK